MTIRLQLLRLTCEQPSNASGDGVALAVYTGPDDNPSSWIWTSGEEVMRAGSVWEVNATTCNFSGEVCVSLMDPDDTGAATHSYGRLRLGAAQAVTPQSESPVAQFDWHGSRYALTYRVLAAQEAVVSTTAADPDLESDLGMLKNGSRLPLSNRLADIRANASTPQALQTGVLQLTALCREAVKRYERERLEIHLRDTTDDDAEKTATATRLSRDAARMEFFLGWMYYAGYGAAKSWEVNSQNRGPFPDTYLDELGNTMAHRDDREWCTSYNGSVYRWLGFDVINSNSENNEKRIFWSGYRLQQWGRTGQNVNGSALGDPINTEHGGAVRRVQRQSAWVNAEDDLPGNLVTWRHLWDDLQGEGLEPQPGDILLMKRYGHTMMIDAVEASGENFYIYTIEGNSNNAVRSRRINLRSNSGASTFKQRTRRCLASNTARCESPPSGTPANQIRRQFMRQFAIALIRPAWDNFAAEAAPAAQAVVASDDAGNGASNVIDLGNIAPPGELLAAILEELKNFMASDSLPDGPWIENPGADRVWDWCGRPTGNMAIN